MMLIRKADTAPERTCAGSRKQAGREPLRRAPVTPETGGDRQKRVLTLVRRIDPADRGGHTRLAFRGGAGVEPRHGVRDRAADVGNPDSSRLHWGIADGRGRVDSGEIAPDRRLDPAIRSSPHGRRPDPPLPGSVAPHRQPGIPSHVSADVIHAGRCGTSRIS